MGILIPIGGAVVNGAVRGKPGVNAEALDSGLEFKLSKSRLGRLPDCPLRLSDRGFMLRLSVK